MEPRAGILHRGGIMPRLSTAGQCPPPLPRRPARSGPAAACLLAGLCLLAGVANWAQAQTAVTLVSNTGQADGDTGGLANLKHAQSFTTGPSANGWTLTAVDVDIAASSGTLGEGLVTIRTSNTAGTRPTSTVLGTLSNPSDTSAGTRTFTSTDGIRLDGNTTYFVHFDRTNHVTVDLQNTTSDDEDSGATSGWSIADISVFATRGTTDWAEWAQSKKIAIKGYANSVSDTTAPTVSSATVNGTSLVITFNENLAAAANLANTAFTVKKTPQGGNETTVSLTGSPAISGATVTLTLASAVVVRDTDVKVSYTKPTSGNNNKLKDAADNEVDTFTNQAVTATGVPVAPTKPTLVATTTTSLTIAWTHPASGFTTLIRNYVHYREQGTSNWRNHYPGGSPVTQVTIPNLKPGTRYQVRVVVTNMAGGGRRPELASRHPSGIGGNARPQPGRQQPRRQRARPDAARHRAVGHPLVGDVTQP